MKAIKPIEIVDIIEKLYQLDKSLESLPPLATDKIPFKIILNSIGDLISLSDQYQTNFFEPSPSLPYHWAIINIGDRVALHLETSREIYKITY
jgi:hypothetical protein